LSSFPPFRPEVLETTRQLVLKREYVVSLCSSLSNIAVTVQTLVSLHRKQANKRQLICEEILHHSSIPVPPMLSNTFHLLQNTFSSNRPAANALQRPCLAPQAAAVLLRFGFSQTDQPEAFAAVTVPVPSVRKHGFNFATASKLLPCRGCSSVFTSIEPEKQSAALTGGSHCMRLSRTETWHKQQADWKYMPYCF